MPSRGDNVSQMDQAKLAELAARSERRTGPLDTPCLIWTGYANDSGYGITTWAPTGKRLWRVHRLAWVLRHGAIPADTPCVLHHCDVRRCWADDHLWLGTKTDNGRDRDTKGRTVNPLAATNRAKTHCPAGHPYSGRNLHVRSTGFRTCKECNRIREAERRARRRVQTSGVS